MSVGDFLKLLEPSFTGIPTDEQLLALGYTRPIKRLSDGRICAIMPIGFTDALCIGIHPWGHNHAYYYRAGGEAATALKTWDGEGEPTGWVRHPQSGRRRTDGDPAREYYQP
jgi:hypothetical protein